MAQANRYQNAFREYGWPDEFGKEDFQPDVDGMQQAWPREDSDKTFAQWMLGNFVNREQYQRHRRDATVKNENMSRGIWKGHDLNWDGCCA